VCGTFGVFVFLFYWLYLVNNTSWSGWGVWWWLGFATSTYVVVSVTCWVSFACFFVSFCVVGCCLCLCTFVGFDITTSTCVFGGVVVV